MAQSLAQPVSTEMMYATLDQAQTGRRLVLGHETNKPLELSSRVLELRAVV